MPPGSIQTAQERILIRVSGQYDDIATLRDSGRTLAKVLANDDRLHAISLDWNEPTGVLRVDLGQARLRQLGLTQSDVAGVLRRGEADDRTSLAALQNPHFAGAEGIPIPLSSIATLERGDGTADPQPVQPRSGDHRAGRRAYRRSAGDHRE